MLKLIERQSDLGLTIKIASVLNLPRPLAKVLINRGAKTVEDAIRLSSGKLSELASTNELTNIKEACRTLADAIRTKQKIGVFGDYDADGGSSTAQLVEFLRDDAHVPRELIHVRIAKRKEGYGYSVEALEEFKQAACKLVVLLDCGTNCLAVGLPGPSLICLDHHLPAAQPAAVHPLIETTIEEFDAKVIGASAWSMPGRILINPNVNDDPDAFKSYCTAGLVFRFLRRLSNELAVEFRLEHYIGLAALGTLADMAHLSGDNRIIARNGVKALRSSSRPGIIDMCKRLRMNQEQLNSADVSWRIAPTLNAAGRVGNASIMWQALDSTSDAPKHAQTCISDNAERKATQAQALQLASDLLWSERKEIEQSNFIFLASEDFHPGILGIVAGHVARKTGKPTAIGNISDGIVKASVRAPKGIRAIDLLDACAGLMIRHGGHAASAGLNVEENKLDELRQALSDAYLKLGYEKSQGGELEYDAELSFGDITPEIVSGLRLLEPYGEGFSAPVFRTEAEVTSSYRFGKGKEHAELQLVDRDGCVATGLVFSGGDFIGSGKCDVVYEILDVTDAGVPKVKISHMSALAANSLTWEEWMMKNWGVPPPATESTKPMPTYEEYLEWRKKNGG